ncbi:DUF3192 domain-containing protein [Shewanella maritima]|uniref:DUF3192 domain-containing protein n=1 Tax=Shewanella maritima TaxID=2520507 RepID=UPI003736CE76
MNNKVSYIIGGIFIAYLIFVAVVMVVYEPKPEDRSWEDRQAYNQQKVTELSFGTPETDIIQMLGRADFVEAKTAQDGLYKVLFYRTHHVKSDGKTTKDECTPLLFRDGLLVAWGENTFEQYLSLPIADNAVELDIDDSEKRPSTSSDL